jgi:small subunit ribosomal protein S16
MLKIRLSRRGKKRQPTYRIVVADVESKRDGRYVELIGWYNPLTDPSTFRLDEGRALHWLSVGAQPTDAVNRLLKKQGTLDRLPRVHKGEAIEDLVAEFEGRPVGSAAAEEVAAEAEVVEEKGLVEKAVDAAKEVAEEVVEAVQETAAAVVEAVSGDDDEADDAEAADAEETEA